MTAPIKAAVPVAVRDKARAHLGYLDSLRAAAAIFVILDHCWYEIWPSWGPKPPAWTSWLGLGHAAVDLFIVLSGFCLMLPVVRGDGVLRGGALSFFRKRARRILPPYYFGTAFSLLLIWTLVGRPTNTHWDVSLPVTGHAILVHLLLLQNFTPSYIAKINHAYWTISLEWWIYFLFPPLVLAWKRLGGGAVTAFCIVASSLLGSACSARFHSSFTLQYIALFAFGMLGAEIVYGHGHAALFCRNRLPWGLIACSMTVLAWFAATGKVPHFGLGERSDFLVGLWAMCLIVTLGLRPSSLLGRALSQQGIVFLGSFAYSIYLIHAPLIQVLWQYVLHPLHLAPLPTFLLLTLCGTPLIIACAYGFHLACERPFMSKPGVKIKTGPQAEAAAIINPAP